MHYHSLSIMGAVRIMPVLSLSETASILGMALGGLTFRQDESGKYDEFPSFSVEAAGLSFALLGIPEPNEQITPITDYELQIGMAFCTSEAAETCDASRYFAELIRSRTDVVLGAS